MRALWEDVLGTDAKVLINETEEEIIKYLLSKLSSRNWKDRQAACNAFEAFLPKRPWIPTLCKYAERIWLAGMVVLEDERTRY